MSKQINKLKLGGSTIAFLAVASFASAYGQATTDNGTPAAESVENVVVTGTSIRGAAPTGSNLITVGTQDIQAEAPQNIDEVLKSVPALSDFGQAGQGQHNSTFFSPNIHQLGGSASGSTLVIMDGMRMPLGGTSHSQPDPSIIPTIAIERVEVLADGSSSIYGSDAVAGVINFITRTNYDGVQIQADGGGADNYATFDLQGLLGTSWQGGSAILALQHSYASDIALATRVPSWNFAPQGGTNQNTYNCNPATIQPGGSGPVYLSATATTSQAIVTNPSNAPCSNINGDYLPREDRDNAMMRIVQDFGQFEFEGTLLGAVRRDVSYVTGGTLTATAFGPGYANAAQINPFYVNPPGVTATSQTIRYDFNGLIPTGVTPQGSADLYANLNLRYQVPSSDWEIKGWMVAAQDNSYADTYGGLCSACAVLALNGTTSTGGSLTSPSIVGTTVVATQALTTANALDVWNPVSSNRTSAATLTAITQGYNGDTQIDTFEQFKIGADGTLFTLPAGPIKAAIGGEDVNYGLVQKVTKTDNIGPAGYGSGFNVYNFARNVQSVYGEINVPVISPEMNIPLVQKFSVDVSGRYDHYSDVGPTKNPKFAADWTVINDLKFRATYSTSFVAPQLDSVGDPALNYRAAYGGAGLYQTTTAFPTALYPGTAGVLPGCAANATTCNVGTATTPGITLQRGIGPTAKPQLGNGYTLGADYAPSFLPGFVANVTLWDAHFKGAVTSPNASVLPQVPGLNYLFRIFPTGLPVSSPIVQAALAPYPTLNSAVPSTVYVIDDQSQNNIENLYAQGVDMTFSYDFDTDFGHFHLSETATELTQYDISFGYPEMGPRYSLLNTDGQTSQFPEIQLQSRGTVGYSTGPFQAQLFVNYIGAYRNWSGTSLLPLTRDANGNPNGGGDPVKAYTTFDMYLAYDFPDGIVGPKGLLGDDEVYFSMQNMFDNHPPFYDSAGQGSLTGTDDLESNLIGRLSKVGIRIKF
jgi:iron complex outermembrane receptor protein